MSVRFAEGVPEEMKRRAREPGRGRNADSPTQIPASGWKDILLRLYASFFRDRIMLIAAGATFYLLLALFPAVTVFVSLYGFVFDPASITDHVILVSQFLPQSGVELLETELHRLTSQDPASLSFGLVAGLLFSLWSANNGVKTLFEAMNVAYGEAEERSFLNLNAIALCFTIGAFLAAIVLIFALGVLPAILSLLGLSSFADNLIRTLRWVFVFVLIIAGISLVYRYGPSRNRARWSWVIPGALLTSVVWLLATIGYSYYLQSFANYSATYGSLGAVIGFMMWVWISSLIFIIGAEVNAEMEHQTARDTTKPPDEPLGERGAYMADTIGESAAKTDAPDTEKKGLLG